VGATGKSDVPKIVDKVRCNDIVDSCLLLTDFEEVMFCPTILLAFTVTGLRPQSGSGLRAQTTAPMEAGLRLYSCAERSSCIYS